MRVLFFTDVVRHYAFEPIGVMYLAACLKEAGHDPRLVQHPRNWNYIQEQLKAFKPDILAFSVTTGVHRYFLELNKQIRSEYDAFSVFGGAHPTYFPEVIEEEGVDAVCVGEGEKAIVDLVNALDSGATLSEIPNFWIKEDDAQVHKNSPRDLVADLDTLPVPDREFYYDGKGPGAHGIVNMFASRGCPYRCSYCFNNVYQKLYPNFRVRYRSVSNLIEEALSLKDKYNPQFVSFYDDCLVANRSWLREFSEAWAAKVQLPFLCNARFDLINEEIVELLKHANCSTVIASLETGNDHLRNEILKRNMSREQIYRGASLVKQAGIGLLVQGILGLPLGSLEADLETLEVMAKIRPSNSTVTLFQPYPRTELGELAIEKGLCSVEPDDIPEDFRAESILDLPDKRKQERLVSIFGIAVEFKLLRTLLPILLCLPISPIGTFFTRVWNGYCAKFRLYPALKYSLSQTCVNVCKYVFARGG